MTIAKLDRPANGAWRHDDPRTARTLPSRYFYDPEIFEREKRDIFYRGWHFAGHGSEFAEPGDYVMTDVLDQSVIVVRGLDGVVRGFHNVCQHRGTRLLEQRRGRLAPEDIELNVGVQKGLKSFGYDQGRYMIDPERNNVGEHLVLHFHGLVYDAIHA